MKKAPVIAVFLVFCGVNTAFGGETYSLVKNSYVEPSQSRLFDDEDQASRNSYDRSGASRPIVNFAVKTGAGYTVGLLAFFAAAKLYAFADGCKSGTCGYDAMFFGLVGFYPLGSAVGVHGVSKSLQEPCSLKMTIIASYAGLLAAPILPVVSAAACSLTSERESEAREIGSTSDLDYSFYKKLSAPRGVTLNIVRIEF